MGELYALTCAIIWACAVILLKRSGETVSPFALNFYRVSVSSTLLLATLLIMGEPLLRADVTLSDYLILILSGIIAIGISDTLFHMSLNMVGAGISAIVDCLYSPFTVGLAWLLLNEHLSALQLIGMALVVSGMIAAAGHTPAPGASRRQIILGVVWGVLAMFTLALGIVIAKPVLEHTPVIWATTVRQLGCLAALLPIAVVSPKRREHLAVIRPNRDWRFMLPGAILGSYLSLIFWIAGMKYVEVGVAAILNQSSTIYVLILAAIFLREPFTRRKAVASLVALAGILLVTIG